MRAATVAHAAAAALLIALEPSIASALHAIGEVRRALALFLVAR
jgi:hypothetical protein